MPRLSGGRKTLLGAGRSRLRAWASRGIQLGREVVEIQFLQALADGVELGGAVVDETAALFAEVQGLAEAGLAGVEAVDDLLEALDRVLV